MGASKHCKHEIYFNLDYNDVEDVCTTAAKERFKGTFKILWGHIITCTAAIVIPASQLTTFVSDS